MSTPAPATFLPQVMLSPDDLALLAGAEQLHLAPGTAVIREGQPGDAMYALLEGELVVTVQGKRIDYLHAGTILGEMAMVDDRPRSATATTVGEATLARISRADFLQLIRRSPQFAARVMNIMSVRTRRLMEEEVKRHRMEEELAVGRRIQLSLLPPGCPQVPGYEFAAGYRAAREVGGDLYDFIVQPDDPNRVHVVIADVTGKGVPAALYMAVSRTLLRASALDGYGPGEALRRANAFIRRDETSPLFLSAFYVLLDAGSGRLTYANAGHNPPIWIHGATGEIELLLARGLLLGAFEGFTPEEHTCVLDPGDFVVFFTDGITEARSVTGDFFDDEGLETVVQSRRWSNTEELLTAIVHAVDAFAAGVPQADDFTVVVLHRLPAA